MDQRKSERQRMELRVVLRLVGQAFEGSILNVSKEGALIRIDSGGRISPAALRQEVRLEGLDDVGIDSLGTRALLVRNFEEPDGKHFIALRFLDYLEGQAPGAI